MREKLQNLWDGVKEFFAKRDLKKAINRRNIIIAVLVLFFAVYLFKINSAIKRFGFLTERDSSFITEIGQIKEAYIRMGTDMNEIRQYLGMSSKSYQVFEVEEEEEEDRDDVGVALFRYVDFVGENEEVTREVEEKAQYVRNLAADADFVAVLGEKVLTSQGVEENAESVSLAVNQEGGANVLFFYLSKSDGELVWKGVNFKEDVEVDDYAEFKEMVMEALGDGFEELSDVANQIAGMAQEVAGYIAQEDVLNKLNELQIEVADNGSKNLETTFSILGLANNPIGEIVIDHKKLKMYLVDLNETDVKVQVSDFAAEFLPFVEGLDNTGFVQKRVNQAKADLEDALEAGNVESALKKSGMQIAEPYEDEDRVYYDVVGFEGEKVSSIVIEKATGVINVVNADGTGAENLLFFDPESKKKL